MPVLILGKGKLSREESWGMGREPMFNQREKKENGGEQGSVPVGRFWEGLLLCGGVELLHPISHVSVERLTRIPILLPSIIPGHCTAASAQRREVCMQPLGLVMSWRKFAKGKSYTLR